MYNWGGRFCLSYTWLHVAAVLICTKLITEGHPIGTPTQYLPYTYKLVVEDWATAAITWNLMWRSPPAYKYWMIWGCELHRQMHTNDAIVHIYWEHVVKPCAILLQRNEVKLKFAADDFNNKEQFIRLLQRLLNVNKAMTATRIIHHEFNDYTQNVARQGKDYEDTMWDDVAFLVENFNTHIGSSMRDIRLPKTYNDFAARGMRRESTAAWKMQQG